MVLLLGSLDLSWRTCWLWVWISASVHLPQGMVAQRGKVHWKTYETYLSMDFFLPQYDSQGNSKYLTMVGTFNQWWLWCWQCSITYRLSLSLSSPPPGIFGSCRCLFWGQPGANQVKQIAVCQILLTFHLHQVPESQKKSVLKCKHAKECGCCFLKVRCQGRAHFITGQTIWKTGIVHKEIALGH